MTAPSQAGAKPLSSRRFLLALAGLHCLDAVAECYGFPVELLKPVSQGEFARAAKVRAKG
jgi:hypothetical protein